MADWATLLKNPNDVGKEYANQNEHAVTAKRLAHGLSQVDQLLTDRPMLRDHLSAASPLREWAIRRFAGGGLGRAIVWDAREPLTGAAEHVPAFPAVTPRVRVSTEERGGLRRKAARSAEGVWALLVVELHNVSFSPAFYEAAMEVPSISRREFATRVFSLEVQAVQLTRAYYVLEYLPWAQQHDLKSNPDKWFCNRMWGTVDKCLEAYQDDSGYPWSTYSQAYDDILEQRRQVQRVP